MVFFTVAAEISEAIDETMGAMTTDLTMLVQLVGIEFMGQTDLRPAASHCERVGLRCVAIY